jgi:fused signal recognition particle receptor
VTTETLWIVVAVVAAVLLIALVLGFVLRRRRRISLREPLDGVAPPRRGGTYQAESGFSFSSGTATEPRPAGTTPAGPDGPPTAQGAPRTGEGPADGRADSAQPDSAQPSTTRPAAAATGSPPAASPAGTADGADRTGTVDPAGGATRVGGADPAHPATPATATPEAPSRTGSAPPVEDIAPAEGRLERLRGRLARSRSGFGQGLLGLLGAGDMDEESWEDVETMLLQADLGPDTTVELVGTLRAEMARRAVRTPDEARALLRDVLTDALRTDLDRSVRVLPHDGRPAVLLVVGVNGTGKTTTTGKLARVLVASGHHVVLGAADTFRAAAAEQLTTWGERAGATVVRGAEGADPASVAFDAVKQGAEEGADAVLLDTAGRLHTKTGLMDELGKVKRVVSRQAEVDEVLLVLDATTGQNGLTQARVFGDVVKVTGIVLTKLDGTAKGGIVFRVQRELGVPVKLVGLGEGPDDLAPFEPAAFVDALLT